MRLRVAEDVSSEPDLRKLSRLSPGASPFGVAESALTNDHPRVVRAITTDDLSCFGSHPSKSSSLAHLACFDAPGSPPEHPLAHPVGVLVDLSRSRRDLASRESTSFPPASVSTDDKTVLLYARGVKTFSDAALPKSARARVLVSCAKTGAT